MGSVLQDCPNLPAAAARKLLELAYLPDNWDTYGSPPIHPDALYEAITVLAAGVAEGLPTPQIGPASGGGVHLVWRSGTKELEIQTWGTRPAEYLFAVSGEVKDDGTLQPGETGEVRAVLRLLASDGIPTTDRGAVQQGRRS